MKTTVNAKDLLKALNLISLGIPKKPKIDRLERIHLMSLDNSIAVSTAYSLDLYIKKYVTACSERCGIVSVNLTALKDTLRSTKGDVTLTLLSTESLEISAGAFKYQIQTYSISADTSNEFLARYFEKDQLKLDLGSDAIHQALDSVAYAMAYKDIRYYLNGMLFEIVPGNLRTVATDGHRLAYLDTPITNDEAYTAIVPRDAVHAMQKAISITSTVALTFSAKYVRVVGDDCEIISTLIDGVFPRYTALFPKDSQKFFTSDASLVTALKNFCGPKKLSFIATALTVKDDLLTIEKRGESTACAAIPVKSGSVSGPLGITANYLLEALEALDARSFDVKYSGSVDVFEITSTSKPGQAHLIKPMRI